MAVVKRSMDDTDSVLYLLKMSGNIDVGLVLIL